MKWCIKSCAMLAISPLLLDILKKYAIASPKSGELGFISKKEAMFYTKLSSDTLQCNLCPRACTIKSGGRGFCRARQEENGKYYSYVYGNPTAVHVDPIEKKPLFHFLPGTAAFSLATAGCNFRCKFCQNWQISQSPPEQSVNYYLPPEGVVSAAKENNCKTIAYTYTEPTVFFEYMLDTSRIARKNGLKNMYHSNGFINQEPLQELCKYLDGANIDLKYFSRELYNEISEGNIGPVLKTLVTLKKNKVHLEITNLIVPAINDNMGKIREMCDWIKTELGKEIPLHFSRFYPLYKLENLVPTPVATLEKARDTALSSGLQYVYIGNIPTDVAENTYCPKCRKLLIKREGYQIMQNNIISGKCKYCSAKIYGVWN